MGLLAAAKGGDAKQLASGSSAKADAVPSATTGTAASAKVEPLASTSGLTAEDLKELEDLDLADLEKEAQK
jgi:hypothetical protein